jgi:sugar diacid utilization regulator
VLCIAKPGAEVLGVIALVDPDARAGAAEELALTQATTALTLELVHLRVVAETELRLRRDLVEELLAGTDPTSAKARAQALGYDLARPHRVVILSGGGARGRDQEAFFHAVRRAVRKTGVGSLLVARANGVAVLCDGEHDWEALRGSVISELGPKGHCRVGVGAPCIEPRDFRRSNGEAQLALKVQIATGSPEQVSVFEELGIYKLLSEIADIGSVEGFVHQWLGPLLDYDATKGGQLVETLARYLECGGSYDATAAALLVHRSTLRYRLQRLREISGLDLTDPDTRFNLQLATRAWTAMKAMRRP